MYGTHPPICSIISITVKLLEKVYRTENVCDSLSSTTFVRWTFRSISIQPAKLEIRAENHAGLRTDWSLKTFVLNDN